jgi:hypothetical protein
MADMWYAGGSRLKLRYYEGGDGTKQFTGWFDSMRAEDCGFSLHSDGTTRCMPQAFATFGTFFTDAGCTATLGYATKGTPNVKYAIKYETGGTRRFPATAPHVGAVYSGTPASCNLVPAGSFGGIDVYDLGAEVPSTSFVDATLKTAP